MRAIVGGIIGGFLAVLIVIGVAFGVMAVRARGGDASSRAALLREIDAYERWYHEQPVYRRNACNNSTGGMFGDFNAEACKNYTQARERFLAQHPAFASYHAWLIDTRLRESGRSGIADWRARHPTIAEMRDPQYLDRYEADH